MELIVTGTQIELRCLGAETRAEGGHATLPGGTEDAFVRDM